MLLSPEQLAAYERSGHIKCPHCGSTETESTDNIEWLLGVHPRQGVVCRACMWWWYEIYTLTSIELHEPVEVPNEPN